MSTVAPQPTSSASLTEQGAVVTFSPQASMGGPPPSVAGVEGQKAEGKADSVWVGLVAMDTGRGWKSHSPWRQRR